MKNIGNFWIICCLFLLGSCGKDDGYYSYSNKESVFDGSTIAYYESKPGVYDSLLLVLNRVPDYKAIVEEGDLTLFSPTNASFRVAVEKLNLVRETQGKPLLNLSTVNIEQLDTLLSKYLVRGLQTTDSMQNVDGLDVRTIRYKHTMHAQRLKQDASGLVGGGLMTVFYTDRKNSTFESRWVRTPTSAVDIKTNNGVIHVLASGHEFGFGEFINRMNK